MYFYFKVSMNAYISKVRIDKHKMELKTNLLSVINNFLKSLNLLITI